MMKKPYVMLGHISPILKLANTYNAETNFSRFLKFGFINTRTMFSCYGFQLGCIEGHTFKPRFFETGEICPFIHPS